MKKRFFFTLAILAAVASCEKPDQPDVDPGKESGSIVISPSSVTLSGDGETTRLAVETTLSDLTCESSEAWLSASLNGKELTVTAPVNPEQTQRQAVVTVSSGSVNGKVTVTQAAGSKYPGYNELGSVEYAAYTGGFIYKIYKNIDPNGGQAELILKSADGRYALTLEFFTKYFETPDDVTLAGSYSKGSDDLSYNGAGYVAQPGTFVPGCGYADEEDEVLDMGSYLVTTIGETENLAYITDGSFTITENSDGTILVKTDLRTADGSDVKFFYEGGLELDLSMAAYPGDAARGDATAFTSAKISYEGSEDGVTHLSLYLYCEGGLPSTCFSFYVPEVSFEALPDTDLSGTYYSPDRITTFDGQAGTVDLGALLDLEGFTLPLGSYVMYDLGDYLIPDGMVSLTLTRQADGKYIIGGMMMNADFSDYVMFLDETTSHAIEYYNPNEEED